MIRIGKIKRDKLGKIYIPKYKDFKNILVTKDSEFWSLSSTNIITENKQILSNVFEFSKVFKNIKKFQLKENDKILWEQNSNTHLINNKISEKYFKWREIGINTNKAIFPNGVNQYNFEFYLPDKNNLELRFNELEGRTKFIAPLYSKLIKKKPKFKKLRKMLNNGENLLLISEDGCHQESLPYYMGKYGVKKDFIKDNTILVNEASINILLNDKKHPFYEIFYLAINLLNKQNKWLKLKN